MNATIVVDLGYGDAGKGSTVDWLTRTQGARLVVRFNGGAQAAHNVITPNGRHHTFRMFGSGTLAGARTHLSRFVLVDPFELAMEARELASHRISGPWRLLTVDRDAPIITPYHKAANRLRELARGLDAHGTCGAGIGETMADAEDYPASVMRAGDLAWPRITRVKLEELRAMKEAQLAGIVAELRGHPRAESEIRTLEDDGLIDAVVDFYVWLSGRLQVVDSGYLGRAMRAANHTVFEGAQGVLLDEWYGFHPHTTWSTTTPENARTLLAQTVFDGDVTTIGVLRAYAVRHGPGPFPTFDPELTVRLPEAHNGDDGWQGKFRVGWFDAVATRYAVEVSGGIDALAITCLDRLYGETGVRMCYAYDWRGHGVETVSPHPWLRVADGLIRRIAPLPVPGSAYQEKLTWEMFATQPCYEVACPGVFGPRSVEAYCRLVSDRIGVPVGVVSTGPTADDKRPVRE